MHKIKNYVNIPKSEWVELNTTLSTQYKSADPDQKTKIIEQLFRLNKPLFKSWNVFDKEDRPDFEQQSFLWTWRALECFKPEKGSFVAWLRWFVLKAWTEHQTKFNKKVMEVEIEDKPVKMKFPDHFFWKHLKREFPEDWDLIKAIYLDCEPDEEIAKRLKISQSVLDRKKSTVYNNIKLFRSKSETTNHRDQPTIDKWLTIREFARKFGYTVGYVRNLVNRKNRNGWYLDKKNISPGPVIRIHYQVIGSNLIAPQFRKVQQLSSPSDTSPE